ncbi:MAG: hypothetical protein FWC27_14430 [Firmicutes bacterium]|nr:hypothetical protein [Bacillota bacterium]
MKKLFILCMAMLLLAACGQTKDTPATSPQPEESTSLPTSIAASEEPATATPAYTQFTETEYQLFPPEQEFDAAFEAFYEDFKAAVHGKDMRFIDGILDDGVISSLGGEPGTQYFHDQWDHYMWAELEKIVALGGVYDPAEKSFTAPYIYTEFQKTGLDPYEHYVLIEENVPVYEDSCDPPILDMLDYSVVKFHGGELGDTVGITTLSGAVGHTRMKYLRSPIDYRLCIAQKDGGWKLLWLIAGD